MKRPHTLVINRSDSKCGNCGRPAYLHETHHRTVRYWTTDEPGCGQRFVLVTSDYVGEGMESAVKACRPDLEWVQ